MPSEVLPDLGVVIATTGRRSVVQQTLASLLSRRTLPGWLVVAGASPDDLPATPDSSKVVIQCSLAPRKGLTVQRNHGANCLPAHVSAVCFLDDDVELHDHYFREVAGVFNRNPGLAAFSACVLANGGLGAGEARSLLDQHRIPEGMPDFGLFPGGWAGLYGCAMNIRRPLVEREPFDERLPLYAIGEDTEIGFRLRRHGQVGGSARCPMVHLATRSGRISEVGVGYAQVVNHYYYGAKGIGYPWRVFVKDHLMKAPLANLWYALFPGRDPRTNVDRRGRLKGNLAAYRALIRGRATPESLLSVLGSQPASNPAANTPSPRRVQL